MCRISNLVHNQTIKAFLCSFPIFLLFFALVPVSAFSSLETKGNTSNDLIELSLEELMSIEVTSVSKKPEKLADAAAAIFVITREDIRRSGATCLPEALRMAPGLNVARVDSSKWAVSTRGFLSRFSNKLLVLIDGRSVYIPCYSGVYWEFQDVMLEDVERIEVIRGPGATLWGANAVNGVINIITRHASKTQGGILTLGAGTEEQGFVNARYGTTLGENSFGRIYLKAFKRDGVEDKFEHDLGDDWNTLRGGFRVDSLIGADGADDFTIEGDFFTSEIDQVYDSPSIENEYAPYFFSRVDDQGRTSGGNILARYNKVISPSASFTIQTYYDYLDMDISFIAEKRENLDLDIQYRFAMGRRHDVICGLGYRYTSDEYSNTPITRFDPGDKEDDLFSAFIQDEITLIEDYLWLTLGSKYEHNDYSGSELQPSGRLFWSISSVHKLWAAASQAVRTPSRMEQDMTLLNSVIPPFAGFNQTPFKIPTFLAGKDAYDSEDLTSYEMGYRFIPSALVSFDMAVFFNDYDELRTIRVDFDSVAFQFPNIINVPFNFTNDLEASSYGFELAAKWQPVDWWKWDFAYSYLYYDFDFGSKAPLQVFGMAIPELSDYNVDKLASSSAPKHQISVSSFTKFADNLEMNIWFRYIDQSSGISLNKMSDVDIDSYFTIDANLIWRPLQDIELSIVGQNLLEDAHPEYVQEIYSVDTKIERSLYGKVTCRF